MPLAAIQESRAPQTGRRKTATPSRQETNRISSPIKAMCVVGQETQLSLKPNSGCSALENQRRAIILSVSQQVGKTKSADTLSSPQNNCSASPKRDRGMLPKRDRDSTGLNSFTVTPLMSAVPPEGVFLSGLLDEERATLTGRPYSCA